jgi:hypothetical protein
VTPYQNGSGFDCPRWLMAKYLSESADGSITPFSDACAMSALPPTATKNRAIATVRLGCRDAHFFVR